METQLGAKSYALSIFINIEGAFDSISSKSIKEAMTKREVPEAIVNWTQNMLTNRNLTVSLRTVSIGGRPIGGCPQERFSLLCCDVLWWTNF